MICPKCKAQMPDEAPYCVQCGHELPEVEIAREGETAASRGKRQEQLDAGQEPGREFTFTNQGAKPKKTVSSQVPLILVPGAEAYTWIPKGGYALPLQRLGAFILDVLIVCAGVFFLTYLLSLFTSANIEDQSSLANTVFFLLNWLYFAGMESSPIQATPGKLVLGIKVTDYLGLRPTFLRATARHFCKILSFITLLAGYAMILFTRRRQGLHDILSGSLVVGREEGESTQG